VMNRRKLRKWHRRLGVVAVVFTITLSMTGLLLNHEPRLNMNKIPVSTGWILGWYGIAGISDAAEGIYLDGQWLTQIDSRLYLDLKSAGETAGRIVGAVALPDFLVVADQTHLTLLTRASETVERFTPSGVNGRLEALARSGETIFLKTQSGIYASNLNLAHWEPVSTFEGKWSGAEPLPREILSGLRREAGGSLPLYRIVLDLHSGRILGWGGRLAMDGAAIVLIILSVTGLWIWWSRK